jgi:hypothetical protein
MLEELTERITRAETQILTIKNKRFRRDLLKMLKTIDLAFTEVDIESVECRRIKKTTTKFVENQQKVSDLLDNLEHHITFAHLIG